MKKILSILICLVLGIGSAYSAATITVYVHAENADGTVPVHGTVTLTKTKSKDGQSGTVTTSKDGNAQKSISANGKDNNFLGFGGYDPIITLSCTPESGYYVYGIYLKSGGSWVLQGSSIGEITSSPSTEYIYKVVFAKEMAPATITASDTLTLDIWTGTEKSGSYPYSAKRRVNLTAAFNKDGVAQFDKLYIFGLTTGDSNNNITLANETANSNAVTPCFIYAMNGDGYKLETTIANVNVPTKPTEFNITSGKKLYFTGYAPYASCGSTYDEIGVFFFKSNSNLDIYLDNLQIYARPKANTGNVPNIYKYQASGVTSALSLISDHFNFQSSGGFSLAIYTQGTGSAFCFQPTNGDFSPNIHLKGENILESTEGMKLHVDISVSSISVNRQARQLSAPIQVIHNKNTQGRSTTLTIDDKWTNGDRTNGKLNLARASSRPAPTIDLGYSNTTLNINGGQIFLSNSFNTSDAYTVSYAISYRQKSMLDGLAQIFGLGDDQPGGTVNFNDGSINCKPLTSDITQATPDAKAVFARLYHNATSMKCPLATSINGGTYNCDVLACSATEAKGSSPKNGAGKPVCLVTIPVEDVTEIGTAKLNNNWMNYASQNGANTADLGYYGIESLQPTTVTNAGVQQKEVYLMLPSDLICFKEELTIPWVICFPQIEAKEMGETKILGGDKDVVFSNEDSEGLTVVKKTSRLLYGMIDQRLMNALETYETAEVELTNGTNFQQITNTDKFAVYEKIYMLMPVVANEWKMFSPPFDISNVYIIESYPEKELLADYGTDVTINNRTVRRIQEDNIAKARTAQSHRMLDLFYQWLYGVELLGSHADFWSNDPKYSAMGHLSSYSVYIQEWLKMYSAEKRPVIEQLYHYAENGEYPDGKKCWDANFYLYKADKEWSFEGTQLQPVWNEVNTISTKRDVHGNHKIIMNKGEVYAMCFPYSVNNSGTHDPETIWDYWTGKYILLEGYASATETIDSDGNGIADSKGQMLSGSQTDWNGKAHADVMLDDYITSDKAVLRGNSTFAKIEVEKDNGYFLNSNKEIDEYSAHNIYVRSDYEEIDPAGSFMLMNEPASSHAPGRRAVSINFMTGEVVYEDDTNEDTSIGEVPTIAGKRTLVVYAVSDGLCVNPLVPQQVSIYTAAGQLVATHYLAEPMTFALPNNVYLVAGEKESIKIVQ